MVEEEARVRRWLTEAEGYLELGLLERSLDRLTPLAGSPHHRLEYSLVRGAVHREQGAFGVAVPYFEEALRLEPGNVSATVGLGWCLKRTGRIADAAAVYEQALTRHPDVPLLHYNLACYRSLQGRAPEAVNALERALALDEDFRELVPEEHDFDPIRELPEFRQRITGATPAAN